MLMPIDYIPYENSFVVIGETIGSVAGLFLAEARARVPDVNDLLIGLASATGNLGSGVIFAAQGFKYCPIANYLTEVKYDRTALVGKRTLVREL